jgi:hypothetical protein
MLFDVYTTILEIGLQYLKILIPVKVKNREIFAYSLAVLRFLNIKPLQWQGNNLVKTLAQNAFSWGCTTPATVLVLQHIVFLLS